MTRAPAEAVELPGWHGRLGVRGVGEVLQQRQHPPYHSIHAPIDFDSEPHEDINDARHGIVVHEDVDVDVGGSARHAGNREGQSPADCVRDLLATQYVSDDLRGVGRAAFRNPHPGASFGAGAQERRPCCRRVGPGTRARAPPQGSCGWPTSHHGNRVGRVAISRPGWCLPDRAPRREPRHRHPQPILAGRSS